ncbi:MAG TPA: pseudouridine synthase, partial [Candidatus Obscuribacter sp.]|nr:pseudouridine synthase [Candidatus Obscuribacter sp.]
MPTLYRLNRAIALTGIASRRKADELIAAGKVMVNGTLTTDFSLMVDIDHDQIVVDGEEVVTRFHDYLLLNKPKDYVSTCDDERGRRTVLDLLPPELRHLKPVGRLDRDSEGLILLTNDGELAKLLTHPSHDVAKIYEVTVKGQMQPSDYSALAKG